VTSVFLSQSNTWQHKLTDDKGVTRMANGWLEDQEKEQFFYNGIHALEQR